MRDLIKGLWEILIFSIEWIAIIAGSGYILKEEVLFVKQDFSSVKSWWLSVISLNFDKWLRISSRKTDSIVFPISDVNDIGL